MSSQPPMGMTDALQSGYANEQGQPGSKGQRYKPFEQMSDQELISLNDEWFSRVTRNRQHVERWALLATAFYLDQQYVDFYQVPNAGTMLTQLPAKKGRVRTVDNLIEPAVRSELARLLRNRPYGVVVPDGLDGQDYEAARAGQRIIEHVTREQSLEEYFEEAALWALFGGTSVIDTQWDPEAGPEKQGEGDIAGMDPGEIIDPLEGLDPSQSPDALAGRRGGDPNMAPQDLASQLQAGGQMPGQGPMGGPPGGGRYGGQRMGDFEFRTLSCFELGVPHIRKADIEDQPYVMITKAYELDEIYERWGVEVEADTQGRYGMLDERMTQVLQGGMSPTHMPSSSSAPKVPTAIVKETWIKPSRRAPDGLILITAGGQILEQRAWPEYLQRQYPFAKIDYTKVPGSFWSKGMVQALIPLQRRHNRAASGMVEQVNLHSSVGVALPRGTQVKGALGGKSTIYEMPPGSTQPAHNVQVPEAGELILREIELTRQSVSDLTFMHEVSRGTTPPNVRSGTAINSLKEMDDSASSIPIRSIERAVQKQGNIILSMARQLWSDQRVVTVLGEEGDIEARAFIRGDQIGGNFWVQPGSGWPFSKAEKEAEVYRALEYGLIDQSEASRVLEMGGLRKVFNERQIDLRHARRENQLFEELTVANPDTGEIDLDHFQAQVEALRPADWHEHLVHLQVHNRMRKMAEFEQWPTYRQYAFTAHITAHQAALQAQMVSQQPQASPGQATQSMGQIWEQQMQNTMGLAQQQAQGQQQGQPQQPGAGGQQQPAGPGGGGQAPGSGGQGEREGQNVQGPSPRGEGAPGRQPEDQPDRQQGE